MQRRIMLQVMLLLLVGAVARSPVAAQSSGAAALVFTQAPTDAAVGGVIAPAVTVEIRTASGAVVTSADDLVSSRSDQPSGGTLGGTTAVRAVNGVATFSDLTLDHSGLCYTLDAAVSGLPKVTSSAFNLLPILIDHTSATRNHRQRERGDCWHHHRRPLRFQPD